jgi:glycosyltransferase involved in cell wall biosynthesis
VRFSGEYKTLRLAQPQIRQHGTIRPLRILLDYRPALRQRTGVGEYAHQMAAAIARRGDEAAVTLFSSSWKDRLLPGTVPGAAVVDARVPVRILNLLWHRLGWPPVETFGPTPDIAWSLHPLLMPSRGAAQVVSIHDLYFLDRPEATTREVRRDYAALAAAHARRAHGIITISEYTRGLIETRLGIPRERITVCYPGAPPWPPRPAPAVAGPILHLGTIEPRKNVQALIRAYLAVAASHDTPPLVLAGRVVTPVDALFPPDTPARLRAMVECRGYVSDEERGRLLRAASMLVVPSADEGFGIPALEAMTVGLPVIAAARGSLPEVVGDAGVLVDPADAAALPAAIRRVLGDPALRSELAARGIARARRFDWDASAGRLLEAFRAALARRRSAR